MDPKIQREFLDLFRGADHDDDDDGKKKYKKKKKGHDDKKKKKDDKGKKDNKKKKGRNDSSSEEEEDDEFDDSFEADLEQDLNFINDMCGRGQFFLSMSPYHIEAYSALARVFVGKFNCKYHNIC